MQLSIESGSAEFSHFGAYGYLLAHITSALKIWELETLYLDTLKSSLMFALQCLKLILIVFTKMCMGIWFQREY